ncbi:MAG: hypothetical protein NXI20_04300 [bacterium]|nr:hypothetical protein [bacterium]
MNEKEQILFKYGKVMIVYYLLSQLVIGSISSYIFHFFGSVSYPLDEFSYGLTGFGLVTLLVNLGFVIYLKNEIDREKPLGWLVIALLLLLPYFGIVTLASWKLLEREH